MRCLHEPSRCEVAALWPAAKGSRECRRGWGTVWGSDGACTCGLAALAPVCACPACTAARGRSLTCSTALSNVHTLPCQVLEGQGKAKLFKGAAGDDEGVKFFTNA